MYYVTYTILKICVSGIQFSEVALLTTCQTGMA